jgi:hypothetical protein
MRITLVLVIVPSIPRLLLPAEKQKIVFDRDLAGDIDDAFTVALILSNPELSARDYLRFAQQGKI